jgi:hypothetical protein
MEAHNVKLVMRNGMEVPLGDGIPLLIKREGRVPDLYGTEAYVNAEKPEEPEEYPTFEVGEIIELKGYPFVVMALNSSSVKLRPVPPEGQISAWKVMREMKA